MNDCRAQATPGMTSLCVLVLAAAIAERTAEQQRLLLIAQLERSAKSRRCKIDSHLCLVQKDPQRSGLLASWKSTTAHTDAQLTHGMCGMPQRPTPGHQFSGL